jgi:plasmid stabilization system protein ParE
MIPVRFSHHALADLEDIAAYIEARNPVAAKRVINRIEELCFALSEMPGLGRPSEVAGARKLLVPEWDSKIASSSCASITVPGICPIEQAWTQPRRCAKLPLRATQREDAKWPMPAS